MGVRKYDKIVAAKGYLVQTFEDECDTVSIYSLSKSNVQSVLTVEKKDILFDLHLNVCFMIKGGCIALTPEEKLVTKVYHNTKFNGQIMSKPNFELIKRKYIRECALK